MACQSELLGLHLARLYEDELFTDTTFIVGDRKFHVHRVVLSMSGFFSALLSQSWNDELVVDILDKKSTEKKTQGERLGHIEALEFTIECEPLLQPLKESSGGITPESFGEMIRFLYGLTPHVTHETAHSLLSTASFFDVPGLMQVISDYIFSGLTDDNCSLHLAFVHNKEFGDAGKLIEDASFAYLFRNAVDIGESRLLELPLVHQKRMLLANELFVPSEFVRYQLVVGLLRQSRLRICREERQVLASKEGHLIVRKVFPLNLSATDSQSSPESTTEDTDDDGAESISTHIISPPSNTRASATSEGSWEGEKFSSLRRLRIDTRAAASSTLSGASSSQSKKGVTTVIANTHRPFQRPICELSSISDISGQTRRVSTLSPTGVHTNYSFHQLDDSVIGRITTSRSLAHGISSSRGQSTTESYRATVASSVASMLRAAASSLLKSVGADESYSGGLLVPAPTERGGPFGNAGTCDSPSPAEPLPRWDGLAERIDSAKGARYEKTVFAPVGAEAAMRAELESLVISTSHLDFTSSFSTQRTERNFRAEMSELRQAYSEILESLRLTHMTENELKQVLADGEISHATVMLALETSKRIKAKLIAASNFNVSRVSELDAISPTSLGSSLDIRETRWLPYRFGIEMNGIFSEEMSPLSDGEPRTKSSERISYAGSHWCLDVKRYQNLDEGQEFVAVYLRRRPLLLPDMAGGVAVQGPDAPEDTRERTTMGFSIRLCGAPGAPTSNSVCGRSVMGKAFGVTESQSWGWESFVSLLSLTEKPWSSGDTLRFVVSLEML
jgi:hypothetical protein